MQNLARQKSWRRGSNGSAISEFGPAMGLLFLGFFFPLLDLLSMGVAYGCCMVLNYTQVHEASLINWSTAIKNTGPIRNDIPSDWRSKGFGQFVKVDGDIKTDIGYRKGQKGSDGIYDQFVVAATTVTCSPLLTIPLPVVNVPGLNGPMTFSIVSERPMENPDYAKQ